MAQAAHKPSQTDTQAAQRDLEHKLAISLGKTLNVFVQSLNKE